MRYLALVGTFDSPGFGSIRGEGKTPEEARKNCREAGWECDEVYLEIAPGVRLTEKGWSRIPGFRILVAIEWLSRSTGGLEWKFLAVYPGTRISFAGTETVVGKETVVIRAQAGNLQTTLLLPTLSMQMDLDESWGICTRVDFW